ncbi:hypothetical protein PIB30_090827 [Stylosanthes scabra]|uniref:Aminotransferase-like plant mobile domain-containing protein n=1 Tax=Stylosanthes scabra TaxID=79078 RepID=A0ABU6XS15_9FABA|nr:hypothetical protein [Stylosanthes scabra]
MRATEILCRLVAVCPWCTPGYIRDSLDGVPMDEMVMFSLSLSGLGQMSRDHHVGKILRLRYKIDTLHFDDFIWTPYTLPVWGGLYPAWVSEEGEVETWRASVSIVCFMFVQYHPADRVKRQFDFKQPILVDPVNLDKFLTFNARGEDRWWPTKLDEYYGHWMARRMVDHHIRVVYTPDTTIPTKEYAEWWGRVCKA